MASQIGSLLAPDSEAASLQYPHDFIDKVLCGDCLDVLKQMPTDCVDCIVTDPPYGISFMGKQWDRALPPIAIWREALRVLKPGAFAFVMCIPRQDCLSYYCFPRKSVIIGIVIFSNSNKQTRNLMQRG